MGHLCKFGSTPASLTAPPHLVPLCRHLLPSPPPSTQSLFINTTSSAATPPSLSSTRCYFPHSSHSRPSQSNLHPPHQNCFTANSSSGTLSINPLLSFLLVQGAGPLRCNQGLRTERIWGRRELFGMRPVSCFEKLNVVVITDGPTWKTAWKRS